MFECRPWEDAAGVEKADGELVAVPRFTPDAPIGASTL
jgi:hypothetical protein